MNKMRSITGGEIHIVKVDGDTQRNVKSIDQGGVIVDGTRDYELLDNKPSIESVTLIGNKTLPEFGLNNITNVELAGLLTL